MKNSIFRNHWILISTFLIFGSCSTQDAQISPNCTLHKTETDEFELRINWSFVNDTLRKVEKIGIRKDDEWSGTYDWVFVYGVSNKSENKMCWTHIWDGDVVKVYGPTWDDNSRYGRKRADTYSAEEAYHKFQ